MLCVQVNELTQGKGVASTVEKILDRNSNLQPTHLHTEQPCAFPLYYSNISYPTDVELIPLLDLYVYNTYPAAKPIQHLLPPLEKKAGSLKDVSRLSVVQKGIMRDRSWMKKRQNHMSVNESLETAKQKLTALATVLKRYTKKAAARGVFSPFQVL